MCQHNISHQTGKSLTSERWILQLGLSGCMFFSEDISDSDINNDGDLGESICNIDLFSACLESKRSFEIFTA